MTEEETGRLDLTLARILGEHVTHKGDGCTIEAVVYLGRMWVLAVHHHDEEQEG